jgi:hypothetical protein
LGKGLIEENKERDTGFWQGQDSVSLLKASKWKCPWTLIQDLDWGYDFGIVRPVTSEMLFISVSPFTVENWDWPPSGTLERVQHNGVWETSHKLQHDGNTK